MLLCLVPCDRVTNTSPFAQDVVLALKVLCPRNPFGPRQSGTFGDSIQKALPCYIADGSLQAEGLPRSAMGPERQREIYSLRRIPIPSSHESHGVLGKYTPRPTVNDHMAWFVQIFPVGSAYHLEDKFYTLLPYYRNIFYRHGA